MLFGNSDAIDYYANNTTIGDAAAETIGKTTKIVNKAVK
jgi:ApbE superfamily uncharacterized protein (UPF0280 family)